MSRPGHVARGMARVRIVSLRQNSVAVSGPRNGSPRGTRLTYAESVVALPSPSYPG